MLSLSCVKGTLFLKRVYASLYFNKLLQTTGTRLHFKVETLSLSFVTIKHCILCMNTIIITEKQLF